MPKLYVFGAHVALAFCCCAAALPAHSLAATILGTADGRTWHDTDLDGSFNDGVSSPAAVSLIAFSNGSAGGRAAIEFDLMPLQGQSIPSASLALFFTIARDLTVPPTQTDPNFGLPTVELIGYAGDGQSFWTDVLETRLLAEFSPQPQVWATIDVTEFLRELSDGNEPFAGFTLRVKDDLSPQTNSHAWFTSSFGPQENIPRLTIETAAVTVPEPASLASWLLLLALTVYIHPRRILDI